MSVVLGIWWVNLHVLLRFFLILWLRHLVLEGGKERIVQTPANIQITNICYGEKIVDANSRDVVKLSFESLRIDEDEEEEEEKEDADSHDGLTLDTTVLCALSPGKAYCFLEL